MKIETPIPPQRPRSAPSGRQGSQEATASVQAKGAKPIEKRDSVQISQQAASLSLGADATRMAVDTRELIARGNKEAVVAQPVDVKRLQELLRATGATRETSGLEGG